MDSNKFTHTLLMIPRINTVCTSILQDNGVYGQIDIEAFPLELIPLEKDVLSLEVPDSYKSIFLVNLSVLAESALILLRTATSHASTT
jgi:hypothetical protein